MTNKKIVELFDNISVIRGLKGVAFNYGISRNINRLESEISSFDKTTEMSEEYLTYDKERIELCKQYSVKNEQGEPALITVNGKPEYKIENKEEFDKAIEELKSKHKEAIDGRTTQLKEFEEFLEKESEIEIYRIKIDSVPADITTEQMNSVFPLLEEVA